ncbi:ubiquitin carboxyl-terminal hydrolase 1 [Rhizoctonia solani]|uniref:ubiquitinyl hydrolase 1 n=1 Tax=Rhizoctonia solani TaxID=456999 RepID=A0A0K6FV47_9AGAM|nr:ubiquitin carboxyl-terminal hydrolase 1 [Rhizoctonia solani]
MVLGYLSFGWLWGDGESRGDKKGSGRKIKGIRRRADLAQDSQSSLVLKGCYPGLVNISGTYCFFNSTVQAFASLQSLKPQIDEIYENAERWDVPTPVLDTLRQVLLDLNTPHRRPSSFRPSEVIKALSGSDSGKRSALFSSREHQDAQELFQLLSSVVRDEAATVLQERLRERGLGGLTAAGTRETSDPDVSIRSVFDGLMAQRRSCVDCGYTEAVRHFAFDNISLTVPPLSGTSLVQCLQDYTRLEVLEDCLCSMCSMKATHRRLLGELERQQANAAIPGEKPKATASRKKRERETRKLEEMVRRAIADRKVEDEIKGLKMEKVYSKRSTKQVMIARPPPVLALHLQRSAFFGRAIKNPCRVTFPEYLDIASFTTSGRLSTSPTMPISQTTTPTATPIDGKQFIFPSSGFQPNGTTHLGPNSQLFPPKSPTGGGSTAMYRLAAVVCHYGAHSYGHYVTFRRVPGDRWIRASDADVVEVSLREVLGETVGTFMLYYERVEDERLEETGAEPSETRQVHPIGLGSTHTTSVVLPAEPNTDRTHRVPRTSIRPRVLRSVSIMSNSRSTTRANSLAPGIPEVEELPATRPRTDVPQRSKTPSQSQPLRVQKSPPTSPAKQRRDYSPRPMSRGAIPIPVTLQS